ncbi:MAG TPA: type II secretion system protein GspK [Spirochaetota bacterium]|nr:type II secretion system protein GspK [Spirochaetota bacterium]
MNKYIKNLIKNYYTRKEILENDGVRQYIFNSKGYILLIVLVISAFLVSFTSEFFYQTHIYISYIKRFKSDINSEYLAYSGFELGKAILEVDRLGLGSSFMPNISSNRSIDSYKDIWALDLPEMNLPGGTVKIKIEDENSKINLSVLGTEFVPMTPYYGITQRLIGSMGFNIDVVDCIMDWIDPDSARFPYGAESADYYLNQTPPYSAQNEEMKSIDELLLVKLVTPEIFYGIGGGNHGLEKNLVEDNKGDVTIPLYKLEDLSAAGTAADENSKYKESIERKIGKERDRALNNYFRVYGDSSNWLDEINKININTASFRVLSALSNDMNDDIVTEIIKKRQIQPFTSTSEIDEFIKDTNIKNNLITVKSRIFKITVTASGNEGYCRFITYYDRDNKKILYCTSEH